MEDNQKQVAPQPVASKPPQAPPPSQKPVLLKWLLIVLLFSLAVFGGVLYVQSTNKSQISTVVPTQIPQTSPSPTPDVTANWKTYTSMDNSYTFKYPDQWYIENPSAVNSLSFFQVGATPIHSTSGRLGNETLITIDYSVAKFDDLKNAKYSDGSPASTETTIGNKRVLKSKSLESADILIAHLENGKDHILNLRVPDQNNLLLLDQILQTFKFLDQP